ncbi:Glu/Leu/Phe/Val dehydrogenase dimerization domain-containing protein [Cyclobacterium marinum]|uniref:Glu/Leu/Phe/Val dehydrogenase n=1 Tax=Cyclobacterium marinum (strain ATCC 25205 / DSM 745 / LMG 13164 / NCIMB 1802) TaxID=880070 RepID=G0IWX3_CYCMS|nr:Glu/Leu/Phe/Val dehydrogenase dimerization domain-containing protein [Cyclobacterium marinum]AEL24891.1 Glu/Leu/Phe/Val dehydrogenase [Cyclobacterium marinum DSM 745]
MREQLKKFENLHPEIVFEWNDSETEAEGWLVINSLRGGAAWGDTRMKAGLDKNEVIQLAKNTAIKNTISGPAIGGAKSGINFDPADPRKAGVLERWFKAVSPILKSYYGTSAGINIDENSELLPLSEEFGLWHPQEGIVNALNKKGEAEKIRKIGQLRLGLSKIVENPQYLPTSSRKFQVRDVITGYGLAESVLHFYKIWGGSPSGKKAIIQGWGNVGAAAAYFLAQKGVQIIGISSLEGVIIDKEGMTPETITSLFLNKENNKLISDRLLPYEDAKDQLWGLPAEIFIPAAKSRLVQKDHLKKLINGKLELIVCGANFPFVENDIFLGPVTKMADEKIALIPDFISNAGLARIAAYLMSDKAQVTDEAMFQDVSKTIYKALKKCHTFNPENTKIAQMALEIALQKLR